MKDPLHQIADEKIDVYAENERFSDLQLEYSQTHSKHLKYQLWLMHVQNTSALRRETHGVMRNN